MITNHTLLIKHAGNIEFKAIFTKGGYFRVQIDLIGYEKMIDELWNKGYSKFEKVSEVKLSDTCTKDIFDVTQELNFEKDVNLIYEFLIEQGFECELIEENKIPVLTVTGYGKDLHPDVIANTEDNIISDFTIGLYKSANCINYEPKITRQASSFKVEVKELKNNEENLTLCLTELKNKIFNTERYFTNEHYKKLINSFIALKYINTLEKIVINENVNFTFSKDYIKEFEELKDTSIRERIFSEEIEMDKLRAFDKKNLSFKCDFRKGVLHMNTSLDNYKKIVQNRTNKIKLVGTYRSIKSLDISNVTIISN